MGDAGAELIRLTTQGEPEVEALKEIKKRFRNMGYEIPLVADIHFNADVAIAAASVADKVRINPGNFAREERTATEKLETFLKECKKYGTAVRIGLNHGSLGERITSTYGDTPLGMKEAAMEWLEKCIACNFYNIVISLKSSNTSVMVEAYRLLKKEMEARNMMFPLHLGVTEAGNGDMGRIKSAVGIGTLLSEGIGDTIRVSLTEDPVNEIVAGKTIADHFMSGNAAKNRKEILRQVNEGNSSPHMKYTEANWNDFIIKASCDFGPLLLDKRINDFTVEAELKEECFSGHNCLRIADGDELNAFKDDLLQASRRKFSHPEYIACPGCGRTMYDLEKTFNEVKKRTSHLKGLKIAVMGCIVNGPGEMADADYGYVGEGRDKVAIYRGKEPVMRRVPQEKAIDMLLKIINEDGHDLEQ
jgi:(E)-4-hydroxy-3-methylbut-2-enyl-diphosphate synthase